MSKGLPFCGDSVSVERALARVLSGTAEVFLDAEQLVVLGDTLGAGRRTGLDLAGVGGNGQDDFSFDGGVTAGVDDLATDDVYDFKFLLHDDTTSFRDQK